MIVRGNDVLVEASASITSQSRQHQYLWRLRISNDQGMELDKPYVKQMFEIDPSGSMTPSFSEVVPLPVGKHRVMLSLYKLRKGYDLAQLNDEAKAMSSMILQVPQWVVVKGSD